MAKRVFVGVGHGGKDPGAVGYVKEADANLVIALELRRLLQAAGVTVVMSRTRDENDPLAEEIAEANAFRPDFAIDVHNNAGKGNGFEVLVQTNRYAAESRAAGLAIEAEVKKQGQQSRGLKTRMNSSGTADYYGFLRNVKCPAIIVEGFFVDNWNDARDYDTKTEQRELAEAYADGILSYLGVEREGYEIRIHNCTALNIRNGPGVSYDIVGTIEDDKRYTIVEEQNGWGRLKSGAGWISLAYTKRV